MENSESIVDPEVMKKLLSSGGDGPLKDVKDVPLPEPWSRKQIFGTSKRLATKRGPRSQKEWKSEVRKVWGDLLDEDKLANSWIAMQPTVQKLAASKSGGRAAGQGAALQELLKRALVEVQRCYMERQTREILRSFPDMKMKDIATKLRLDRSPMSRNYTVKAVSLLSKTLQKIIDNPN